MCPMVPTRWGKDQLVCVFVHAGACAQDDILSGNGVAL